MPYSNMEKIKSYNIIEGKWGYVDCQVERDGVTYRATMSKEEFDFRMWKQDILESGKLSQKEVKKLDSIVERLMSYAVLDYERNNSESL